MIRVVIPFLSALVASGIHAQPKFDTYVDLEKTNQLIEFEADFEACDAKANFRTQDGAMVAFAVEGRPTVRFIVKKHGPGDIKLYMVESTEKLIGGQMRQGLMIRPGVDVLNSVASGLLASIGIRSFQYKTDYPFTPAQKATPESGSSSATTNQSANCCCFRMCNKQVACGCSSGPACFFDQCDGCCVSGSGP